PTALAPSRKPSRCSRSFRAADADHGHGERRLREVDARPHDWQGLALAGVLPRRGRVDIGMAQAAAEREGSGYRGPDPETGLGHRRSVRSGGADGRGGGVPRCRIAEMCLAVREAQSALPVSITTRAAGRLSGVADLSSPPTTQPALSPPSPSLYFPALSRHL